MKLSFDHYLSLLVGIFIALNSKQIRFDKAKMP